MAKRFALVWALFVTVTIAAFAGDVAQFVNLGFSPDSRYFMFGQYGILEKGSAAWAGTFIVDVPANVFAPKAVRQFTSTKAVEPGASPIGALLNVLSEGAAEQKKFHVDHLLTGRLLYILVDGAEASDALEFRDFPSGHTYKVTLAQKQNDAGASFGLSISLTEKDGAVKTINGGHPALSRPGVKAYHIKQIILAPDGSSLVFLVQKEEQDTTGYNIRYMVETVRVM
jgi:predicted secreted protein